MSVRVKPKREMRRALAPEQVVDLRSFPIAILAEFHNSEADTIRNGQKYQISYYYGILMKVSPWPMGSREKRQRKLVAVQNAPLKIILTDLRV